jgi:hypothetical protein
MSKGLPKPNAPATKYIFAACFIAHFAEGNIQQSGHINRKRMEQPYPSTRSTVAKGLVKAFAKLKCVTSPTKNWKEFLRTILPNMAI